jgi:excisionase family DNA binding protein
MENLMNHANEVDRGYSGEALTTAVEVAKRLGVSERWVRDHATRRSPRMPVIKLGCLLRFPKEDVEEFINAQRDDHSTTIRR